MSLVPPFHGLDLPCYCKEEFQLAVIICISATPC
uniref:Uncharacterized protein n=1 Tax=Arundo donax TaxID=35708 RepID=A0A0A9B262_ARUDO